MIIRRAFLLSLVLITGACAVMNDPRWSEGYTWHQSSRKPLPMVWLPLGADFVNSVCPHYPGFNMYACAFYEADACLVVAALPLSEAPEFQIEHERTHCDGMDHEIPTNIQMTFIR